jgi:hypothetical protein
MAHPPVPTRTPLAARSRTAIRSLVVVPRAVVLLVVGGGAVSA